MKKKINFMKIIYLLQLLTIVAFSKIFQLTDQNFNSTITTTKYVIVKFYVPQCGHCKTLAPQFIKFAELIKENDVLIAQIDGSQNGNTREQYEIRGYPTIKLFIDGVDVEYRQDRNATAMYQWFQKASQTFIEQITQEKIDEMKEKQSFVVYHGQNSEKKKIVERMKILDDSLEYFYSPSSSQKLVLYLVGRNPIEFNQSIAFNLDEIEKWATMQSIPIVIPMKSVEYVNEAFYVNQEMKDTLVLLREKDMTEEGWKNVEKLCAANREKFRCSYTDNKMDKAYAKIRKLFNSNGESVLALTRDTLKQTYRYQKSINHLTCTILFNKEQTWSQFTREVNEDKHRNLAEIKIKYQHAKTLTHQNFTTFVQQHEVVFVKFYNMSCIPCAQFFRTYEAIAQKVSSDDSLNYEITVLDVKKNRQVAAGVGVSEAPAMMLFIHGQSLLYEGPVNQESILRFIKRAKNNRPTVVQSVSEIESPAVIIYDPAEVTQLKFLPVLFSQYPIYHIRHGQDFRVVLRQDNDTIYQGENKIEQIVAWLQSSADTAMLNLLGSDSEVKITAALQNKIPILSFIDVDASLSVTLRKIFQMYCKQSSVVLCGYAQNNDETFAELAQWFGVQQSSTSSLVYLRTQTLDKYHFTSPLKDLNIKNIEQFVNDVQNGKIKAIGEEANAQQTKQHHQQKQAPKTEEITKMEETTKTEENSSNQKTQTDDVQNSKNQQSDL